MNTVTSGVLEMSYVPNTIKVTDERIGAASFWHYKVLNSHAIRDCVGPNEAKLLSMVVGMIIIGTLLIIPWQ
jgi:hypothetical protein